ncbi:MAG: nucleotidyltransferase family protein, partial [Gammaproteobacteria bacterium]|nr:nucleotidyltransferase family protein [Gammaproteobacteria bacterium]
MPPKSILLQFLSGSVDAELIDDPAACELLLRQARSANLLSRVAVLRDENNLIPRLPQRMQYHLQSAQAVAVANHRSVKWEAKQIELALAADEIPFCLLKGGAYVVGQSVAAKGRVFSDV